MEVKAIGFDFAKNVFQLHGVDLRGRALLRKRRTRAQLIFGEALGGTRGLCERAEIRLVARQVRLDEPRVNQLHLMAELFRISRAQYHLQIDRQGANLMGWTQPVLQYSL